MVAYEYEDERSGQRYVKYFEMGKAPAFIIVDKNGNIVKSNGTKARRVYGASTIVPDHMKAYARRG